jgi:outer membrane receptor protein involved in Fe transport
VVVALALSVPAWAQTTGTIRGQVNDADGGVLPGVTVTVESEALLGDRTVITGSGGSYLFAVLPVGTYSVTAALDGFQTQRVEEVRVNINATITVSFVLPEVFGEEVVVVAETPLLDVTSASVGTNYSSDFMEDLPTARNFWDLVAVSPGISQASEQSDRQIAFGASLQSNAWHVDGLDTSSPDTGSSWWYLNPDTIAEVQVLGVGAPAEFGNMLGAAFNVVTKSGGNEVHGSINTFWQTDSLTDTNLALEDSEFPSFHRDKYHDITGTLGGPIKKDKAWFFAAAQNWRDGSSPAGVDPAFATLYSSDRYDLKITWRLNDANVIEAKGHYEDWAFEEPASQFALPSALGVEAGNQPAWGISWQSILSDRTMLEIKYAGWEDESSWLSQTGSTEVPFVDWSAEPETYSGGTLWEYIYPQGRDQGEVALSHFADDFLAGDHDFKFGVQYNEGFAHSKTRVGADGYYIYRYPYWYYYYGYYYYYEYFKYIWNPAWYGAESESLSAYIDDSWHVSDKLTLSIGVRYDRLEGRIPEYDRLDMQWQPTGETIPGADALTWTHFSPRLGFAYAPNPRTTVRGSFGVYYDANVTGNWNYPPVDAPPVEVWGFNEATGEYDIFWWDWHATFGIDPDLEAPRSLQYALGFERQIGQNMAFGATAVYKDTENLIGWELLDDGVYEDFPFTDPFTGNEYILWNEIEQATLRKGNKPGVTANPDATEYYQEYTALMLSFKKRMADNWSMMASYTLSESTGLTPRTLSDWQFNPFYGSTANSDPNNYINGDQHLQGDRLHMFNVQANFLLPYSMHIGTMVTLQSGRPYSRQIGVWLNQGKTNVIMEPASDDQRFPSQALIDLSWGKRFKLSDSVDLNLDLQLFNLLNEDAPDYWESLSVGEGGAFVPDYAYITLPRRLQLRFAIEF